MWTRVKGFGGPRKRLLQVSVPWKIIMWTLWIMELVMFLLFSLSCWNAISQICGLPLLNTQYLSGICFVYQPHPWLHWIFFLPTFSFHTDFLTYKSFTRFFFFLSLLFEQGEHKLCQHSGWTEITFALRIALKFSVCYGQYASQCITSVIFL